MKRSLALLLALVSLSAFGQCDRPVLHPVLWRGSLVAWWDDCQGWLPECTANFDHWTQIPQQNRTCNVNFCYRWVAVGITANWRTFVEIYTYPSFTPAYLTEEPNVKEVPPDVWPDLDALVQAQWSHLHGP